MNKRIVYIGFLVFIILSIVLVNFIFDIHNAMKFANIYFYLIIIIMCIHSLVIKHKNIKYYLISYLINGGIFVILSSIIYKIYDKNDKYYFSVELDNYVWFFERPTYFLVCILPFGVLLWWLKEKKIYQLGKRVKKS